MDGNRRWAKLQGVLSKNGHKKGAQILIDFCKIFKKYAISYLTVYAFSSENNRRENEEKNYLFTLLEEYLTNDIQTLQRENIAVKFIGDFTIFSAEIQNKIAEIHSAGLENPIFTLIIALNYSGKEEICHAINKISHRNITVDDIAHNLYLPEVPDVDLLIRTGGAMRLSNFLLWQITYAELYFCECLWPDFNESEFQKSLDFYQRQQRNFGV